MGFPMNTAPEPKVPRGACVECQDAATIDQVLTSVCVDGVSKCVCERCLTLSKYQKYLGH